MSAGADAEAIRVLVREVLADLLPTVAGDGGGAPVTGVPAHWAAAPPVPPQPGPAHTVAENVDSVELVCLRSDGELAAFVRHLMHLFENPKHRDALRSGRLRFRLAAPAVAGSARPSQRVDKGAVTEAMVAAAARAGTRLVLGPRAVLTPLARDRARAAGVEITRER